MKILYVFLALALALAGLWGCGQRIANIKSRGTDIICFGDSITRGEGAGEGGDYPAFLSGLLGAPVINAGVSGDTTRDGLDRIEEDVLAYNPRLVIVEFSANDFMQGIPKKETLDNLDRIVAMIQQKGAVAVLAEVRLEYFTDEYLSGFRKIARERRALLIPNIMKGILSSPSLKSDNVHPNDTGYRLIAERIYKKIKPLLQR